MIRYADDEEQKGNLGQVAKKIIQKTGKHGTLFAMIKFHFFGERDSETENIEIQHTLRSQIKINNRRKAIFNTLSRDQ